MPPMTQTSYGAFQVRVGSPMHERRTGRTASLLAVAHVDRSGSFGESVWSTKRTQSGVVCEYGTCSTRTTARFEATSRAVEDGCE